jgi:pSer/pThr/pTyr-binding forkhead associated (FHA) protein
MAANVRVTTELRSPSELGVHHRLLCMTGPNKGKVYYLIGKRAVIGRGESVDIQILDTKISREHAELSFSENAYTITDLGAQNGVIVNDHKIKQKKLLDTEKIVIGQTVFKYNIITVTQISEMIIANENPDSPLAQEIKKGVKVKLPPRNMAGQVEDFRIEPIIEKKANSKVRLLIFGVVLVAIIFVLFDNETPDGSKRPASERQNPNTLDSFSENMAQRGSTDDADVKRKLESLIHSGRREFREGNYFRAMEEFRLAMLLSPNNGQASYYLSKAKQRLDEEITKNFEKGNQEYDSKKYQAAIISFCGVVQLIKDFPEDERYKNAMAKVSAVESELRMEKGEIKCFEEKSADSRN